MNTMLVVAAALAFLLGVTHSWLGERLVIGPVLETKELPPLRGSRRGMRNILRFGWHLTSVYFWAMAALLFHYSRVVPDAVSLKIIAVTYFISALITLGASRGRHYAWPVFLTIGLLAWMM